MAEVNNTDGFVFHGWMVNELHLTGGDLLAFALVHQFSQSDAGIYTGNTEYLSAWTGWSENTSRKHLARLVELGLIQEVRGRKNNSPFCHYKLSDEFYEKHPAKIEGSPRKIYPVKITEDPESTPQKLRGENNNKKKTNIPPLIPPTVQEVAEYVRSRKFRDPEGFAEYYVTFNNNRQWIGGNGKPVQNWKNNIISNWEPRDKDRVFRSQSVPVHREIINYYAPNV